MWEMGYLTVLQVRLGAKIGDWHAKDSNAFRKRLMHAFSASAIASAWLPDSTYRYENMIIHKKFK